MLTPLGKYLRKIRIDQSELLKDMADKLDLSPAMLSSIENGKRNVPNYLKDRLISEYPCVRESAQELAEAISRTQKEIKINLENMNPDDQSLAFSFARRFDELDDKSKNEIREILDREA